MSDAIEIAGYFSFFWLFLFSRRYRALRAAEWREGGWLERVFVAFEAGVSVLFGVGVPAALLWFFARHG